MTYRPSTATGRVPAYFAKPGPDEELDAVVSSLTDSIDGLRHASELAEDERISAALIEASRQREETRSAIRVAAFEAQLLVPDGISGKTSGVLRRGWMRLESALGGDAPLLELISAEDARLHDELKRLLRRDLPRPVTRAVRDAADVIEAGAKQLDHLAT